MGDEGQIGAEEDLENGFLSCIFWHPLQERYLPGVCFKYSAQCSTTCGSGTRTRAVQCKQRISETQTNALDERICHDLLSPKPEAREECQTSSPESTCTVEENKSIVSDSFHIYQLTVMDTSKISMLVGGNATIIEGTTVEVRCPTVARHAGDLETNDEGQQPTVVWKKSNGKAIHKRYSCSTS